MGRKRGRERKRRKAGRSILAGKTFKALFCETIREEGDVNSPGVVNTSTEIATMA